MTLLLNQKVRLKVFLKDLIQMMSTQQFHTYQTAARSRESLSSVSSVSSSSSDEIEHENIEFESDSDNENNQVEPDDGNNAFQYTDLRANPPDWTRNLVPIHVP